MTRQTVSSKKHAKNMQKTSKLSFDMQEAKDHLVSPPCRKRAAVATTCQWDVWDVWRRLWLQTLDVVVVLGVLFFFGCIG